MGQRYGKRILSLLSVPLVFLTLYTILFHPARDRMLDATNALLPSVFTHNGAPSNRKPDTATLNNLSLTADQCLSAFPGLTDEIEKAVVQGVFKLKGGDSGPLRGRIRNGQVSLENVFCDMTPGRKQRGSRVQINCFPLDIHSPLPGPR
jgi:hypothetical protein